MKKILSMILAVTLLVSVGSFGLFSFTASASSVEYIYNGVQYYIVDGSYAIVSGSVYGIPDDLVIPSTVNGYPVVAITDYAFEADYIESVYIPSSVSYIGEWAFKYCYYLKQVVIGSGVTEIGDSAFANTGITEITIPGNVETIANFAFECCENLEKVCVKEGVKSLGYGVFDDCEELRELHLPSSLESIGGFDLNLWDEEQFTIYGFEGTLAEEFALKNNYKFSAIRINSLEINTNGSKTEYLVGSELENNVSLIAKLSNGETQYIHGGYEISGYDPYVIGEQLVSISYGGAQCNLCVTVFDKESFTESIEIYKLPNKTVYYENDTRLDLRGGQIRLNYKDGTNEIINIKKSMTSELEPGGIGEQNVTVTFGTKTCTFGVYVIDDIVLEVSVSLENVYHYTGLEIKAEPVVTCKGEVLKENIDYELSYDNNVQAGWSACVFVQGLNEYKDFAETVYFPILRKDISNASVQIDNVKYTSGPLEPEVKVVVDEIVLQEGTDYVVQYRDNVPVGTAIARVVGQGNYCGYIDATFEITEPEIGTEKPKGAYTGSGDIKPMYVPLGTTIGNSVSNARTGGCTVYYIDFEGNREVIYEKDFTNSSFYGQSFSYNFICDKPGAYTIALNYQYRSPSGPGSAEVGTVNVVYAIFCEVPIEASSYIAALPVEYGTKTAFLHIESDDSAYYIQSVDWKSSDETIATVDKGVVTFKKAGTVSISATNGETTATWEIDNEPLDIGKNGGIYYDRQLEKYRVYYKNELLVEGEDYTLSQYILEDAIKVVATGFNLFNGEIEELFYADNSYKYCCLHKYHDKKSSVCNICGYIRELMCILGDLDEDEELTDWDGVMLARYLAGWSIEIPAIEALDIDGDGEVTDWDGVMFDRYLAGWDVEIEDSVVIPPSGDGGTETPIDPPAGDDEDDYEELLQEWNSTELSTLKAKAASSASISNDHHVFATNFKVSISVGGTWGSGSAAQEAASARACVIDILQNMSEIKYYVDKNKDIAFTDVDGKVYYLKETFNDIVETATLMNSMNISGSSPLSVAEQYLELSSDLWFACTVLDSIVKNA